MPGQVVLLNALPRRGAKGRFVKGSGRKRRRKVHARRARRAPRVVVTRRSRRSVSVRAVNRVRRRRRNPAIAIPRVGFTMRAVTGMATNAAIGAGGAISVDIVMGFAGRFLPAQMASRFTATGAVNPFYYLTKGALAIGFGMFGGALVGRNVAAQMAQGALTVMTYELARPFVAGIMPMGAYVRGVGYMSPAASANAGNVRQLPNRMGAYVKTLGTSARMREQGGTR